MTTIHEYHTDPDYTSHSRLRDFRSRGAQYYYLRHVARTLPADPPSKAMIIGQALEDLVQRADDFGQTYVVRPEGMDGRTKEGKAWAAENAGRTVIAADDAVMLNAMAERVSSLLDRHCPDWHGWQQQATLRCDDLSGVKVQARPDWLTADGMIYDLKTCENLDDILSGKSIANYGYHTQLLLVDAVRRGAMIDQYPSEYPRARLVCVEKQEPHRAALVELDPLWWQKARWWLVEALDDLQECQASGVWPLVPSEMVTVIPPAWL